MKRRHLLTSAISSLVVALPAYAGVQTMTSDEMVETYVKDSAVIVVPKERKKSDADRQRILRSSLFPRRTGADRSGRGSLP